MVARNRLVISGPLGTPFLDRWSVGLNFAFNTGGAITDQGGVDAWAVAAAAILDGGEVSYASLTALMGTNVQADRLDVYGYSATGPAVVQAVTTYSWAGLGTPKVPLSTSTVVTLQTGQPGPSKRGRTYWPVLAGTVQPDGQLDVPTQWVTDFKNLLEDLAGACGAPDMRPVVYSPTQNMVTPVTRIRVGNRPDHQRRRTFSVPEAFQTATVVT